MNETPSTDWPQRLLRLIVVIGAAVNVSHLSAPLNMHWMHWFTFVPMLWVLRDGHGKANRRYAFLFGVIAQFVIFFWVAETIGFYSNIPNVVAWAILGLFSLAFGLPYFLLFAAVHPLRRRFGSAWMLAWPAWLVVLEKLQLELALFPYDLGAVQYGFRSVSQLASITGTSGLSFLALFVNAVLAEALFRRREGRGLPKGWLVAAVTVPLAIIGWGAWRVQQIEQVMAKADTMTIAQFQTDLDMSTRLSRGACHNFYEWVEFTKTLETGAVDLVVWPEGASPYPLNQARRRGGSKRSWRGRTCSDPSDPARLISALAGAKQTEILVGAGSVDFFKKPDGSFDYTAYNSTYFFDSAKSPPLRYDKMIPLPFGEYMPLASTFPSIREYIRGPGNFARGTVPYVFPGRAARFSTPICYEAILPGLCSLYPDPQLLINVTNDAWFGKTNETFQHGMLTTFRAVELGIPLYRSTVTGTSFLVEPHGAITYQTEPFVAYNRVIDVRLGRVWTVYSALMPYGLQDWFIWLCFGGLGGGLLVGPWIRRRRAMGPSTRESS